jgi:hypothetical protein
MNQPVVFLSVDVVLKIHRRVIEEFGGNPGLRCDNDVEELTLGVAAGRLSKDHVIGFFARFVKDA